MSLKEFPELRGKQVVFKRRGLVTVEDFSIQKPGAKQVIIKTASTLISSGTETAFLLALPNTSGRFPMTTGYSNAGVVSFLGNEVSKCTVGDKVVSTGSHASHVIASEDSLIGIPNGVSFEEAAFTTLGYIALQGIRKADIELGESVMVLGQGLVGNLALQLAKLCGGMPLIAADLYDHRLGIARKCGADYVFNPSQVDLEGKVKEITAGKGVNVVIEATGHPTVIATALNVVSKYGKVVILGSPRGTSEVNLYSTVHRKGVSVIGAHMSTVPRSESRHGWWSPRDDSMLALKLISNGLLKVKELVTSKLSFWRAAEAYTRLIESKKDTLGILLDWKNP